MSTPTRSASNSLAKDSRVLLGSLAAARIRVVSANATTVTVDTVAELTGTSLYNRSFPGQLEILSAAVATNQGKTALVTNITGNVLTVSADLSALITAGDIIAITPPLSVEQYLNGGHTLNDQLTNDYTPQLTATFDDNNTPMGVDIGGDIPFFTILNSEGFLRLLCIGIGSYKSTVAGTHKYRPIEANDGTYTDYDDATILTQDGNGVLRKLFFGLFGTGLTLEFPENGRGTGTLSVLGNGVVREIGGTGKTYTSGILATRTVADGVLNSSTTVTSATAAFTSADVGATVTGTGIPTGTLIASVTNGTTVVLTQAATATASGVSLTIFTQNYIRSNFACDTGSGITFRSAFVELGGAFGAGLTSAAETTVKNLTIKVSRGAVTDRTLGDPYIVKPEEDMFTLTVSGTRLQQTNTYYVNSAGGANDAEPGSGAKTETRMLIKAVSPADATKTLTLDIPRGVFSTNNPRRQRGRFVEDFEFRMLATLDANGCVSTTTPPMELTVLSSVTKNLATAL